MSRLVNLVRVPIKGLFILLGALFSLLRLLGIGLAALTGKGSLSQRLAARFGEADAQRHVFAVLRALAPTLVLRKRLIKAYENNGTAIITRDAVEELKLKRGEPALAIIKSTEVMIAREAD